MAWVQDLDNYLGEDADAGSGPFLRLDSLTVGDTT
jgi:hypothetical protein